MRTLHIIIGTAFIAAFVFGCSTSSKNTPTVSSGQIPIVRFGAYIDAAGNAVSGESNQATFEFENPSPSLVVFAFHQPDAPRDMITGGPRDALIPIQPNSTNRVVLRVGKNNPEILNVKVMQVVSSRELTVPVP